MANNKGKQMNAAQFIKQIEALQQAGDYAGADAEVRALLAYLHTQGIGGSTLQEYVADMG
jgi:hypothetical protein